MRRLILALLLLSGCTSRQDWVEGAYPGDFPTDYSEVRTSASGVRVSGDVSLDKVDFIIDTVYECLGTEVPSGKLTPEEDRAALCYNSGTLDYPKRSELVVIVAPHELSCDKRQELLTVSAPDSGCRAKGREPTPECPCRWRAGYRDGSSWWPWSSPEHLHIVTPSAYMLSDTLTRLITGCHNPWAVPRLANCARPKVPPRP